MSITLRVAVEGREDLGEVTLELSTRVLVQDATTKVKAAVQKLEGGAALRLEPYKLSCGDTVFDVAFKRLKVALEAADVTKVDGAILMSLALPEKAVWRSRRRRQIQTGSFLPTTTTSGYSHNAHNVKPSQGGGLFGATIKSRLDASKSPKPDVDSSSASSGPPSPAMAPSVAPTLAKEPKEASPKELYVVTPDPVDLGMGSTSAGNTPKGESLPIRLPAGKKSKQNSDVGSQQMEEDVPPRAAILSAALHHHKHPDLASEEEALSPVDTLTAVTSEGEDDVIVVISSSTNTHVVEGAVEEETVVAVTATSEPLEVLEPATDVEEEETVVTVTATSEPLEVLEPATDVEDEELVAEEEENIEDTPAVEVLEVEATPEAKVEEVVLDEPMPPLPAPEVDVCEVVEKEESSGSSEEDLPTLTPVEDKPAPPHATSMLTDDTGSTLVSSPSGLIPAEDEEDSEKGTSAPSDVDEGGLLSIYNPDLWRIAHPDTTAPDVAGGQTYPMLQQKNDVAWFRKHFVNPAGSVAHYLGETPSGPHIFSVVKESVPGQGSVFVVSQRNQDGATHQNITSKEMRLPKLKSTPGRKAVFESIGVDKEFNYNDFQVVRGEVASKVTQAIVKLEEGQLSTAFKVGVLCVHPNQTTEEQMFQNQEGSSRYLKFLDLLGRKIPLRGYRGFRGGLDTTKGHTGSHSYVTQHREVEIMLHVSTCLPHQAHDEQCIEKKRHLGNDIVNVIFLDDEEGGELCPRWRDTIISSMYNHVFIVVRPATMASGAPGYRLGLMVRDGVPAFGPVTNGGVYAHDIDFREFLLSLMINAEIASYDAPVFSKKSKRTRSMVFTNLCKTSSKKSK